MGIKNKNVLNSYWPGHLVVAHKKNNVVFNFYGFDQLTETFQKRF